MVNPAYIYHTEEEEKEMGKKSMKPKKDLRSEMVASRQKLLKIMKASR